MNKRILIVDDSTFMRNIIKTILVSKGYIIVGEASNGKDAIELYKKIKPDLVTMDITMPIIDGITALTHIKEFDPNAIVIMITAMGQQILVNEAIKAGASDFIIKPFQTTAVISAIEKHI